MINLIFSFSFVFLKGMINLLLANLKRVSSFIVFNKKFKSEDVMGVGVSLCSGALGDSCRLSLESGMY